MKRLSQERMSLVMGWLSTRLDLKKVCLAIKKRVFQFGFTGQTRLFERRTMDLQYCSKQKGSSVL